jgi:hypothetical protein
VGHHQVLLQVLLSVSNNSGAPLASVKYLRADHADDPLPILNAPVSVSKPISPAAKIGFALVHCAAVPLRCCILVAIYLSLWYFYRFISVLIITSVFS